MGTLKVERNSFSIATHDEQDIEEKTYWLSKTLTDRLNALELTRQMIYGYNPTSARLQRVLEITKRS
jgi:hypothetical protein